MELAAPASWADDYLCDASCSAFIYRYRGTRENRTCDKRRGKGWSKENRCGLSDVIAAHRYLRPNVLYVTLNYRHLADFKTHCARAITLKFTICRQRKEGQRSKLFKLHGENSCIMDSESNGPSHRFVEMYVQKEATADARCF